MSAAAGRLTTYQHDGLSFDVLDEGPLDGDPIVLLHGFPERASCWRLVAPLLHAHGLRTYAPDQRGYSPGARPSRRRDYRFDTLAEDVVALIDAIGRPVHLVGHDLGAAVGWCVAGKRPDLVRTWTAVSVTHPLAFVRSLLTSRQLLNSWYIAMFNVPKLAEVVAARDPRRFEATLRRAGMTTDDIARFRTEILEYGALPGALGWYRAMLLVDSSARNPKVKVPTTMVWSDGDAALVRRGVDGAESFVEAPYELVVLKGVSHWIPVHAPEALAEAILERVATA